MPGENISVNVADRWHLSRPRPGADPCKCGRGRNKLYPSAEHQRGDRWQVQWREPGSGKQKSANRPKKEGTDPATCADAYASQIEAQLRGHGKQRYVDPKLREGTLGAYAQKWRATRVHDVETAGNLERRLRLHVLEDPQNPGRTPSGGPALGHLTWAEIDQFPSLTQAWISGLTKSGRLSASTANLVIGDVSSLYVAAVEDGLLSRDITKSKSIQRPKSNPQKARAWTEEQTVAVEKTLPARYQIVQRIGPEIGTRLGEMAGLADADIDFLKPKGEKEIRINTQVKRVAGELVFSPLKNKRPHAVPVVDELVEDISAHLARFPARPVTLRWHEPDNKEKHGTMITRRLIITSYQGGPVDTTRWDRDVWKGALVAAGLIPGKGARGREWGTHAAWRHTAASQWLADGVDVTAVAEWLGDTVKVVVETYLHMLPSAPGRGRSAMAAHRKRLARARSQNRSSSRFVPGEVTG